ncbi:MULTISPECIES: DEAD/DEAH box helicase [Sphingobacterium]|uniref:ATP-dependent RNA helicase n=1 Tax=Sphingobacterium athyrii TaxID=2152717 RepID=A0A363NYS8_9SPHI|nr:MULTISPECIES: DEAD/DEAH box helicase [Sphingobacterium]PUV25863.1 ATP-dependent RNA helicase [Sphingobacterium athyrii]QIH33260.1 DEAD/DEAH box helicase [Sphingobacterium sp. DR205]
MRFTEFGFVPELEEGLESMMFEEATPIQEQTIPVIKEGSDMIACAQTGTGKTAAYMLPILDAVARDAKEYIRAIILVPTRELALQIDQQIMGMSYYTGATSISIYGGGDGMGYEQQKRAIREGVNIIVATPGRLISHLTSMKVDLTHLTHFVLDEADSMLDMGFQDDILRIVSYLPKKKQMLLFSATMPLKIRNFARKILSKPVEVNIAISKPSEGIDQRAYLVYDKQKMDLLKIILQDVNYVSVIIFASQKTTVKLLAQELQKQGIDAEGFHSDLEQAKREDIMSRFRSRQVRVLVGTDVISRGIDIVGISLVVNYDVPPDPEDYVHRIGRTARAATTGTAITFVNDKDQQRFSQIENLIGYPVEQIALPEGFEAGPEYNPTKKSGNSQNRRRSNKNRNKNYQKQKRA